MNPSSDLTIGVLLLWMSFGGVASWFAKQYGWSEWRWFIASLLTGPGAWTALHVKIRAEKERVGPRQRRIRLPSRIDWP